MTNREDYYLVIKPNEPLYSGSVSDYTTLVRIDKTFRWKNEDIWKIVGGWYTTVPATMTGFLLLVNEEGLLKNLEVNTDASGMNPARERLVGTVIMTPIWTLE